LARQDRLGDALYRAERSIAPIIINLRDGAHSFRRARYSLHRLEVGIARWRLFSGSGFADRAARRAAAFEPGSTDGKCIGRARAG